jgi:hypothetical protein
MASETLLQIRFAGGGILPENVRAGEMAEILIAVEDMVSGLVIKEHPKLTKDNLLVGLVSIEKGSLNLQFSSQIPEVTLPAFKQLTKSIKTQDFSSLPGTTLRSLAGFSDFIRKKNCEAEFISNNGRAKVLATLTPDIIISSPDYLKGDSVIYGRVIRVGGREPKAMIETAEGVTVYCEIESEDLARVVGDRLYTWASLKGKAKWDSQSLRLEEFKIVEVSDYGGSVSRAFEELSLIAGKYFLNILDVEGYVSSLRGEDEED